MVRWIRIAMVTALSAVSLATVTPAAPANASATTYPSSGYDLYDSITRAEAWGSFIWYNRSVQVGGHVAAPPSGYYSCAAVVFLAYDSNDHLVTRAARPGDSKYVCDTDFNPGTYTQFDYGFTLDASNVAGGIRKIKVELWEATSSGGGNANLAEYHYFGRP
jgi:hypothetical protein